MIYMYPRVERQNYSCTHNTTYEANRLAKRDFGEREEK